MLNPITPEHPAFARIRDAITTWLPNGGAGAPDTREVAVAAGLPTSTTSRYLTQLRKLGWVVAIKSGRGFIWAWTGQPFETPVETPASVSSAFADTRDLRVIRIQLAAANGSTHQPRPFDIYPLGGIAHQDVWQGRPVAAVGFTDDLPRTRINLWWGDYMAAADWDTAIGRYLVTENREGDWAAQLTAVASAIEINPAALAA